MSQDDLAKMAGGSKGGWANLESKPVTGTTPGRFRKLAEVFKMSLDELRATIGVGDAPAISEEQYAQFVEPAFKQFTAGLSELFLKRGSLTVPESNDEITELTQRMIDAWKAYGESIGLSWSDVAQAALIYEQARKARRDHAAHSLDAELPKSLILPTDPRIKTGNDPAAFKQLRGAASSSDAAKKADERRKRKRKGED